MLNYIRSHFVLSRFGFPIRRLLTALHCSSWAQPKASKLSQNVFNVHQPDNVRLTAEVRNCYPVSPTHYIIIQILFYFYFIQ